MRGRIFDRAPRPRWSAGERPPPRAFRLPVGREGPNDAPKRFPTAGSTLPRGCAPFWRSLDASIAVCRGDGRDKSGFPFPRISRPGAEGGDDRHPTTIHNHGEDSFPWLCLVFQVVGVSIAWLTARALSRSPAISTQYCVKYWPGRNGQIGAKGPDLVFSTASKTWGKRESLE